MEGFHLLAIFDPSATTRTISDLLATVRYQGTDGDSDGVTRASPADVVQAVLDANGIPIPAHSDQEKGLLRVNPGTRECALDPHTVRQVMDIDGLLAVEWLDASLPVPACVEKESDRVARVLGSDCHSFRGSGVPGSRFTWIKMASSTLEGLRLALLDGNGVSVRRSDKGAFEPFQTPNTLRYRHQDRFRPLHGQWSARTPRLHPVLQRTDWWARYRGSRPLSTRYGWHTGGTKSCGVWARKPSPTGSSPASLNSPKVAMVTAHYVTTQRFALI